MLKIAFSPTYKYGLPEGHRFPMVKYELIPEQLLYEGTVTEANFFHPAYISDETVLLTHDADFWHRFKNLLLTPKEIRAIGFPISEAFVARSRHIAQGTVECTNYARQYGVAMNVAGGTHHAFRDHAEAFCCLNDQAVASNWLLHKGLAQQILIVDLDVHQGNGTAKIFEAEPRVFTFSMHGEKNYPHRKEKSDLDIPLPDKTNDATYLKILHDTLPHLIQKVQPDFVFYLSGVDVLATDKLGRLGMTREGCRQRDIFVFEQCKKYKIPVVVSMGGGYSERIIDIVEAHANTFRAAKEVFF